MTEKAPPDASAWWDAMTAKERAWDAIVSPARKALESTVAAAAGAASAWSGHFGATGIDPKHLFVYFVVPKQAQVEALAPSQAWAQVRLRLAERLALEGYPVDCLGPDWVEVVSQQACDEQFGGNWYHFFK